MNNRVVDERPVPEAMPELEPDRMAEWRRRQLAELGYATVPETLPRDLLAELRVAFDRALERHGRLLNHDRHGGGPRHVDQRVSVGDVSQELPSMFELDPVFGELMDFGEPFRLAAEAMGGDITLCQAGHGHRLPPRTPAHCGWHRDGDAPYVRCTWLLDEVDEETGPFTLIPGSHRWDDGPPSCFNAPGPRPRAVPGMRRITGPAGTCLVNHTRIWHTNTPNRSDRPRRVIFVLYKPAALPHWNGDGEATYVVSKALHDRQADPLRKALCAGPWLRDEFLRRG